MSIELACAGQCCGSGNHPMKVLAMDAAGFIGVHLALAEHA
jgi:hypothetical protein